MSVFLTILLLIACTSTTPKSQSHVEFKDKVEAFLASEVNKYSTQQNDSKFTWTLDRQKNHTWVKKVRIYNKSENVVIDLFFYEYQDTSNLEDAYEALLGCFPTDCMKLSEGQERKAFKTTPSLFIVNAKTIVVVNTKCENHNSGMWSNVTTAIYEEFSTKSAKIISTSCGGSLKWSWHN